MTSIGHQIIDEIIKQGMFDLNYTAPDGSHLFVWSSGAAEQLEALVDRRCRDVTRALYDAQDMLTGAMDKGDPTILHSTVHAVRDNLRTQLALMGRPETTGK
jgi:hypothetical protein